MRTIIKIFLLVLFICSKSLTATSQQNYWQFKKDTSGIIIHKAVARLSFPKVFKLFSLDVNSLRQELFTITDNQIKHATIISLPNPDGNFEQFEVYEASNFEPDLQARFPQIRAFSGKGITDKAAILKMSISPQGIQTMVFRTEKENEFIEAYSEDHTIYAVFKSQRGPGKIAWTCTTVENNTFSDLNSGILNNYQAESNTGELKTMRLAQSCNGEYSNYFGATSSAQVALVLAAFNATLTRCNGIYEKDLGLHLSLIANTTDVIYYNPATDPYSTSLSSWNLQLQQTLTAVIGNANYDIGHMFGSSGGGGNAGCIGCVCVDPATSTSLAKGSGITSPADGIPQGDNFDIDYVAHEVGHQLGANHTFSHSNEGTGRNKEVGAGITIMGYAGITSYDPAPHSIDIFHQTSIEQIQANLATKTCPVTTNISANNATPVVSPVSNYTIPISTPFALTGSATDANPGDVLTYCWEQNNNGNGLTGANSVASPTKATGPNWLSFSPTTSPTRLFPKLSTILAGLLITPTQGGDAICNVEALSSVSRTLNFRLTVRDNSPYSSTPPVKVGQTAFTDMIVTVSNTSGPFQVTAPNTAVTWASGSSQAITWNVNNTTAAPVSCANVKITLSTDGGNTFPVVIAASTPNDGTETITVPAGSSTTCRIKIEAVGNIFFDISNSNFTISGCTAGTVSGTSPLCIGATATYTSNGTSGGTWSSSNTSVATVNASSGLVTALSAGTANITYTVTAGCGSPVSAFKTLTVSPNVSAGSVSGTSPLCNGNTFTYTSNGTSGGTWSSTNTAVATVNPSTGMVTTLSAGTTNITYTVNMGCGAPVSSFKTLTVSNISSGTVNGSSPLCIGSTATYTSTGTSGGTWSSTNTSVASVNASTGLVTALAVGTTNITYTISSGCVAPLSSFKTLTVNSTVTSGTVSGSSPLCIGNTNTYTSNGTGGGVWSSTNTSVASVNAATGLVTALSAGTSNITYSISAGCGSPVSDFKTVTVNPTVTAGIISGTSPLCLGATATYTTNGTPGGTWSSDNLPVATVDPVTGLVTSISPGTANITYSLSSGCGSPASAFKTVIASQCEFIYGSIKKNADPSKVDIVFKPSYTSSTGEYCLFLQFAVSIPLAGSTGITASASGVNTFSNMGALSPLLEFTETFGTPTTADDERVYGFVYANPTSATQSWTNGIEFTGMEVTFNSAITAINLKMLDLENAAGGDNGNTYFAINTNTGDKRNNGGALFFSIPGFNLLGNYPNNDQFVEAFGTSLVNDNAPGAILLTVNSGCSGSPYTNAGATQSGGEPFAGCKGLDGYKTVWYKFNAPASGNVRISTDYNGGTMGSDSRLALFSVENVNNYATFTNLACDDDNGVVIADRSVLYATGLTPGNTYYIQVDGKDISTAAGTFCLTVDEMESAMLSSETACASGQPLTSVNDNYSGWQSIVDASGKLIALINNPSGGATTSTYDNTIHINAGPVRTDPVSSQRYLDRNFLINNAMVSNVNVQFFFLSSELTALQAADPGVLLSNLQVTRQTGAVCDNNFIAANGTNSSLAQVSNGTGTGFNWIQVSTPGLSKFFLHTKKSFVPVKTFLHGAYNSGLARHKDVNATWAAIMNANALNQPYNIVPFNYTGTESVSGGFFTSSAATTDITDWVLLDLRDAVTPATVIARRAAFIREDGRIVDLDGVSDVSLRTVADGNYHLVIAHRNHLAVRTATVKVVNGTLGFAASLYDFSTSQSQAFQNIAITTNPAQRDLTGGVFGLWGGNADGNTTTRVTGLASINDYLFLLSTLGNNPANIFNNMYNKADVNMDGTIRATGLASINDYLFLLNALDNNPSKIVTQHQ